MRFTILSVANVAVLLLSISLPAMASPVVVDVDFNGTAPNALQLNLGASGEVVTELEGDLVVDFTGSPNPQTDPLGLDPDTITTASIPNWLPTNITGGASTTTLSLESTTWTPLSLSGVNLNLLNAPLSFSLDTILLESTAPIIPGVIDDSSFRFDYLANLTSLQFFQDSGVAPIGPGNLYSLPGTLKATLDLGLDVTLFAGDTLSNVTTGLGTQEFSLPFTLAGSLGVQTTSPEDVTLLFAGTSNGQFPLTPLSTIVNLYDSSTFNLDFNGGLDFVIDYELEDTAQVPEPGTMILFAVGAAALALAVNRRIFRTRSI